MLERVHDVVVQRRLVQERQVPDVEVERPQRQCNQRVPEHAQAPDHGQRQHRAQDRPRQARDHEQRREVADDDVLDHVDEEELLLAEGVDRRHHDEEEECQPAPEAPHAPARHGLAALGERADAAVVEDSYQRQTRELDRVERPAGQRRDRGNRAVSLGL